MTQAMVDRMFWRAGFGPSAQNRSDWLNRKQSDLADWFLNTPVQLAATKTPPLTAATPPVAINPLVSDVELELECSTECSERSTRFRIAWPSSGTVTGR